MQDALVSVFFPAPCRICEKLLVRASRVPICEVCLASFTPIPERACEICGQPLESFQPYATDQRAATQQHKETEPEGTEPMRTAALLCPNCNPPTYSFARARSLAIYQHHL